MTHVEQNEIERSPHQDVERLGSGIRRYDLVGVPVLEAGEELQQHPDHVWLIINDEDPLRELHRRLQCIRGFNKRQIHRSLDARERQRVRPGCRHAKGSTNGRTRIGSADD